MFPIVILLYQQKIYGMNLNHFSLNSFEKYYHALETLIYRHTHLYYYLVLLYHFPRPAQRIFLVLHSFYTDSKITGHKGPGPWLPAIGRRRRHG